MILDTLARRLLKPLSTAIRTDFAKNPKQALSDHFGLNVREAAHLGNRGAGGACDGVSFLEDGVVFYAPTPLSRRENFTMAHELGHFLVNEDDGALDWLADQPESDKACEALCDRIARQLLLPDAVVEQLLNGSRPRARHVLELYELSKASIQVCVIALAAELPSIGAVITAKIGDDTLTYASVQASREGNWPQVYPWPGSRIPYGHPLRNLRPNSSITQRSFWMSPWGKRETYYIDAASDGKQLFAVLADHDLWEAEAFHPGPGIETDKRPVLSGFCCGTEFSARGWPCPTCGQPYCPRCGKCRCERQLARDLRCKKCFLLKPPHLVVGGVCDECR